MQEYFIFIFVAVVMLVALWFKLIKAKASKNFSGKVYFMTHRFLLIPAILLSLNLFSQSTFYIQTGSGITKIEDGDPLQINVKEWQVRLYRRNAPTSGTAFWGTIKGSSANEVMETLKKQQQFELDFNKFIGKGSVEDNVFTHFNPLGPIAVADVPKASELPLNNSKKRVSDLYEKATDLFYTGLEVKNNLDVILNGKENPYDGVGSNFMQYSENIKDNILQLRILQNLLVNSHVTTLQNINTRINEISKKLNITQAKLNKVRTSLKSVTATQNKSKMAGASSSSIQNIVSELPAKYQNSILSVLKANDNQLTSLKTFLPNGLIAGMNEQQKTYFKNFVEDIQYYGNDMALCFGYLSPGANGYGYLSNNQIQIDETDQYYRDIVLRNDQIFETSNYNTYYSRALLEKGNAAYDLFKLLDSNPTSSKAIKNKVLQYGIANANMIYQQAIEGYQDESVVRDKQTLLSKLKESLKK